MYYISKPDQYQLARVCKRLSDFSRSMPEEGSEWHVRKRKNLSAFDSLDVYFVRGGKLVRCPRKSSAIIFAYEPSVSPRDCAIGGEEDSNWT